MKINTNELEGFRLNWMVAICEGKAFKLHHDALLAGNVMEGWWISGFYPDPNKWIQVTDCEDRFQYTTSWRLTGPLIERESICLQKDVHGQQWHACIQGIACGHDQYWRRGRTAIEAALRCYVGSKFGNEVELPDALADHL
jgi:hypothetical protein